MASKIGLCTLCGRREAFFHRPYSGEKLCRPCFIWTIERKVKRTISKYSMFTPEDRIALALSGGKDSLSLLHILHKIEKNFPKAKLYAVTIDEGIAHYRDEAVKHAAEACKKLGVPHLILSFKELYGYTLDEIAEILKNVEGAPTPCTYCGVLRRKALNLAARKLEATKIATAHTLDDEVQTFLLNLVHGDVYKLGRVDPEAPEAEVFIPRAKPFREIPEAEIALYAYLVGVPFQTYVCPYAHQALRNDIRDFLNRLEARHPGVKFTLYHSFERLKPLVRSQVKPSITTCQRCGEPSSQPICEACTLLEELERYKKEG
ncbi:MAG: TIGR00269 family protein [Candidatus Hecatellaceae archaeon]